MSNTIEAQGVTVDEAIQLALNQLGVGRDSVEIKILHHPRSGFLGIGARRAKVRATVREDALQDGAEFDMSEGRRNRRRRRRPPRHRREGEQEAAPRENAGREQRGGGDDRRDSRGGGGRDGGGRETSGRENTGRENTGRDDNGRDAAKSGDGEQRSSGGRSRGNRRGGRGRQGRGRNNDQAASGKERNERESGPQGAQPASGGDRERNRGRGRGRGRDQQRSPRPPREDGEATASEQANPSTPGADPANEVVATPVAAAAATALPSTPPRTEAAPEETAAEALPLEEIRPRAEEIITEILRLMGFEAKVSATCDDEADEVIVVVEADAEGLLIGRRGQTLDAFEHLVNRSVAAREMAENRVIIDVGGYRDRRRESLLELAGRLRERAMSEGRRVQVSPMSPRDRKVFQNAFAGDDEVTTRALGTGFYRRVLIVPEGADEREPAGDGDSNDQAPAGESTE